MDSMTSSKFDRIDARLLDLIQREFPLAARPFEAIAASLGIPSSEAMERVSRLKSDGVIRQISAIFDSSALGYSGALTAFRVRPDSIDRVAEQVSSHAGVSHCYSRDADLNLWFTITLPPEQDIDTEVAALARADGVEAHVVLPAIRIFKIGVFFEQGDRSGRSPSRPTEYGWPHDRSGRSPSRPIEYGCPDQRSGRSPSRPEPLDAADRAAVRALQKDLPIVGLPFAELAAGAHMTEDELLSRAARFLETDVMRRFAAVLRHQRAGYRSNAMVCWRAEPEQIETAGPILASHPSVSHCYERAVYPEWPYPLYTMVHGRDEAELQRAIAELAESSGLGDFMVLRSVKEYKKSRVVYFE